jgi:hypothetical protein
MSGQTVLAKYVCPIAHSVKISWSAEVGSAYSETRNNERENLPEMSSVRNLIERGFCVQGEAYPFIRLGERPKRNIPDNGPVFNFGEG